MFKKFLLLFFISLVFISCGEDKNTDKKDLCKGVVCQNDGTCKEGKCECKEGFTGDTCETEITVDKCSPNPCKNSGVCSVTTDGFTCDCSNTGYEGDTCETEITVDNCNPNPCKNNGVCSATTDGFTCDCSNTGYEGDTCETEITGGCIDNSTCDDGDPCTVDSCDIVTGFCMHYIGNDGLICDDGDPTTINDACNSGVCEGTSAETCDDGIKNQNESDIDCGGSCSGCSAGESCNNVLDCSRGLSCTRGVCTDTVTETCSDGIKNQDETDIDCGGSCSGCSAGESCNNVLDCSRGLSCTRGVCN